MISKKLEEKARLYREISHKKAKILKICHLLTRNKYEYNNLIKKYEKLDREIYEETSGIKVIEIGKSVKQSRTNKAILSDAFIESLSSEARQKLLERLQSKLCAIELNNINRGLKDV